MTLDKLIQGLVILQKYAMGNDVCVSEYLSNLRIEIKPQLVSSSDTAELLMLGFVPRRNISEEYHPDHHKNEDDIVPVNHFQFIL